ncbi:MAG: protein kinase [Myxococcota bacterium]|nr:protein kinase [Myxococcota bacterium]
MTSHPTRAPADPYLGKTVGGRYRLISRLGTGGMSSVYLARHVLIDRLMAIKTLRRDLARDPVQRDRFLREARAVNRINHPNIVEITDFGETDDGLVYLVMEYVPGESLLHALRAGPMPAARAIAIVRQVGGALARAHEMGVVHRDLKPENILLVARGGTPDFVKILDFGIAKILDAPALTGSQQIFGTPGYIAPEYIQSTHIDGRADIYSLGVIFYELVTGALPFDCEFPGDLLVKHVTERPIPPSRRRPGIEPALEEFILRCLEKDPARRFRDAFHFLEHLDRMAERIGAAPTSWGAMNEAPPARVSEAVGGSPRASSSSGAVQAALAASGDGTTTANGDPAVTGACRAEPFAMAHGTSVWTPRDAGVESAPGVDPLRDTVRDTLTEPPLVARQPTADYARPSIPEAPSLDEMPIDVEVEVAAATRVPSERPPSPTPFDPQRDGLAGVRRWRRRFDAIRACLDELEPTHPAPPEAVQAMAFAEATLEELESACALATEHQNELEQLTERARDARATMGRGIDVVAGQLSAERRGLEDAVARRTALRVRREEASARVRAGALPEGEADAVLWELAAVDQEVTARAARCDELEARLAELRATLERHNEEAERRIGRLVTILDGEMARIDVLSAALRDPLDLVERHVVANWSGSPRPSSTPAGV